MDKDLHDFVTLLHRPRVPARRSSRPKPKLGRPAFQWRWPAFRLAIPELPLLQWRDWIIDRKTVRIAVIGGSVAAVAITCAAAAWLAWPETASTRSEAQSGAGSGTVPVLPDTTPVRPSEAKLPPQIAMIPPPRVIPPPELAPPELAPPAPLKPASPGEPQWLRYAVAAPPKDSRPRIAIVIDDMGVDRRRSERAVHLPGAVTLSYLPYAVDLQHQTEAARSAGHELIVHVPMEPLESNPDRGPNELDVGLSQDEVLRRLRWDLAQFDGYVGINNHMGSKFTSDAQSLRPVMKELQARGLLFLDSKTIGNSAGIDLARSLGVPHASRDVFLDNELAAPAIDAQLAETERVARREGSAIAIGHPHDQTLDALEAWAQSLQRKGFVLVPLTAIVKERGAAG